MTNEFLVIEICFPSEYFLGFICFMLSDIELTQINIPRIWFVQLSMQNEEIYSVRL